MSDEVIKVVCQDSDVVIQPIESLWNEIRHTRSTIAYIRALLDDDRPNRNFIGRWKQEIDKLQEKLRPLSEEFTRLYVASLCLLQEFEIKKYDRCYLEIAFLKSTF